MCEFLGIEQVVGRRGGDGHAGDLGTEHVHVADPRWHRERQCGDVVEVVEIDRGASWRFSAFDADIDRGELCHGGRGPENGRAVVAVSIGHAGDDQRPVGVVDVERQVAGARQARPAVRQSHDAMEQDADLVVRGELGTEDVPIFVAADRKRRGIEAGRVDRGAGRRIGQPLDLRRAFARLSLVSNGF